MKRKIALIMAMLTVCSLASCGSDNENDNNPSDLNSSESSSDDSDESSEESELSDKEASRNEDEINKTKELEERANNLAAEQERQEAEKRIEEQKILEEQLRLEEERKQLESEVDNMLSEIDENENESSEDNIDESSSENEDGAFSLGTVNGNVYSSDFSGVTFNLPDNMVFADDEEIMSIMDITGDFLGDKAAALLEISKKSTIYDMLARDVVSGDNIQVMYENLSLYGQSVADAYDVDMYLQAVTKQFAALENSGIKVTEKGRSTIKLGDQDFTKVELETYYETYDFTATQAYYIKKIDDYMLSIVITLGVDSSAGGLEEYENLFE